MILAAGRGERLMPLTEQIPKPLISIHGETLLQRNISNLILAGVEEIIINTSWLGSMIEEYINVMNDPGPKIICIKEGDEPLGTGGGILNALSYFKNEPFWVINADIITDFSFTINLLVKDFVGHLILVKNPDHNLSGDFGLEGNLVLNRSSHMYTFSGISLLKPEIFRSHNDQRFSLAKLLRRYVQKDAISGELYSGKWLDVGTMERLNKAKELIQG